MKFHSKVLSSRQQKTLRQLSPILSPKGFYLGGGTAIALQLGHRRSFDLDWFTASGFDPLQLAQELRQVGARPIIRHVAEGTLDTVIGGVPVTFLQFSYPLLRPLRMWKDVQCKVCSLDDLACMKLSAVAQRGEKKDFVDLYALLDTHRSLRSMVNLYKKKFSLGDVAHMLYALTYFDDANHQPMPRMISRASWTTVKKTLQSHVKELAK